MAVLLLCMRGAIKNIEKKTPTLKLFLKHLKNVRRTHENKGQ